MLEIISEDGNSQTSTIMLNGEEMKGLTKLQVTLEVGEPVRVDYETIAEPVHINIDVPDFSKCASSMNAFAEALKNAGRVARGLKPVPKQISTEELLERIHRNRQIMLDTLAFMKKS